MLELVAFMERVEVNSLKFPLFYHSVTKVLDNAKPGLHSQAFQI